MKEEDPIIESPAKKPEQQKETEPKLEPVEIKTEPELESVVGSMNEMAGVDWGPDGTPVNYTAEYIAAHPDETAVFGVYEGGELVAGGKVTMLTEDELSQIEQNPALQDKKSALLEFVACKLQNAVHRAKIFLTLTQKRLEWAQNNGVQYVYSEVELNNPISAVDKFKMGFRLHGIQPARDGVSSPYLVLRKDVSEKHTDTEHEIKPERTEIPVTDDTESAYQKIGDLLHEGWIGVDIKVNEENPVPWTLILEREVAE